jgi:hypothetical protein
MLIPKIGDIVFMLMGVFSVLFMIILGPGKHTIDDPSVEYKVNEKDLKSFEPKTSPILVIALIMGLGVATYGVLAVILKSL